MLRAPLPSDLPALLALNNAHASEVGAMTAEGFERLVAMSFHTRTAQTCDAFLIGLDEGAPYASANFRWFAARYPRFAYVDRVVVAARARRRGLGQLFYDDFTRAARAAGHTIFACEVNIDPPNPVSDAFHTRLGFEEVGQAFVASSGKTVRYLVRKI